MGYAASGPDGAYTEDSTSMYAPQCLDEENSSVLDHALDLVKKKYGVDLPATDVQACHHLPSWTKGKKWPARI